MSKTNHKLEEKFVGANCVRPHFGEITKRENGITLIALIITIVVILILTGVTLSITLGDNGLVNKAKEVSEQTTKAQNKEILLSMVIGCYDEKNGTIKTAELETKISQQGWSAINSNSQLEVKDENGNMIAFVNLISGEIIDSKQTDSIVEDSTVDLSGIYRGLPDDDLYMLEIKKGNIIVLPDETEISLEVDYETKKIYIPMEYEDGSGNHVLTKVVMSYDLVKDNNEVVNIILMQEAEDADIKVYWQNENGFEYDLDGVYLNEDMNSTLTFETGNQNVVSKTNYSSTNIIEYTTYYFKCNGKYYCNGMLMTVDGNKENIGLYEGSEIYTKQ